MWGKAKGNTSQYFSFKTLALFEHETWSQLLKHLPLETQGLILREMSEVLIPQSHRIVSTAKTGWA